MRSKLIDDLSGYYSDPEGLEYLAAALTLALALLICTILKPNRK
jgi:hypothetical protein